MKIIISPSKTQKTNLFNTKNKSEKIYFKDLTNSILKEINKINNDELFKKFMEINSDSLLKETKNLFLKFASSSNYYKAIELYDGIQFKSIQYELLNKEQQKLIDSHLIILSGFYGMVFPDSYIKPYRLMVGTKLKIENKSLYEYWKIALNNQLLEINPARLIINLASNEYFKMIDNSLFKIINIDFKILKNNKYVSISTFSKKCRGIFIHEFSKLNFDINKIKLLNIDGFTFNNSISNDKNLIFTKKYNKF